MGLDQVDTASVADCAGGCGVKVRRFSTHRWWNQLGDALPPWWCPACLAAKLAKAIGS